MRYSHWRRWQPPTPTRWPPSWPARHGLNPALAGLAPDPGAYGVFNGAVVAYDDGLNSLMYALANNGAVLDWDSGDLFGGASAMEIANGAASEWEESGLSFQASPADLLGYRGAFAT